MPESNVYLGACEDFMKGVQDKFYPLAIVDPPYGIGEDGRKNHTRGNKTKASDYRQYSKYDQYKPDDGYFNELYRVSVNQIIWGANHYGLMPASSCWIVWDKQNGETDFADCELAYTSFAGAVRKFEFRWAGMLQGDMKNKETRCHPNQKPVALYKWLLKNYAKPGDRIFDSHMGSQSSRIAAYDMGFDYDGCEKDPDYFRDGCKRFENFKAQLKLF